MAFDATSSRAPFPKGGYESYYLVAHDPSAARAIWLRYTIHQPSGEDPQGLLWVSVFDATRGAPLGHRVPGVLTPDANVWLRIDDATIDRDGARGSMPGAAWDLRFTPIEGLLAYLPSERMYRAGLPKTKPLSLSPRARFDGTMRLGDATWMLEGWEGMVGHNWGTEHANRWIWLHGLFEGGDWIDLVAARIKAGPVQTPWIVNGAVSISGTRHRLGGLGRTRATAIEAHETSATLRIPGDGVTVHATVHAPDPVRWDYADPKGGMHDVVHSSIAELELEVHHSGTMRLLRTAHAASYELGSPREDR